MRVLVAGSAGQVARALAGRAAAAGVELLTLGRPQLDLEHRTGAERVDAFGPDAIINAAAYTAVDAAESDSARAFAINRDGAAWVADLASRRQIPFVHVSTDYVFGGQKQAAYAEDDPTDPQTVYGRTKRAGEEAVLATCSAALVVRTAWVYSPYGHNFVRTMLRLAAERDALRVVDDQHGNPTSADDLASALLEIVRQGVRRTGQLRGIYHAVGAGDTTWFGFAEEIMRLAAQRGARAVPVVPIATADYPTPAQRPRNARLACEKLKRDFNLQLPAWRDSLVKTMNALLAVQHERPFST